VSGGSKPACSTCGRPADRAAGTFLVYLYAEETFCSGCGRRSLHCTCQRARGLPVALEVAARQLADDPEFIEWAAAERRGELFAGRPR
jgi:hypothetical protein